MAVNLAKRIAEAFSWRSMPATLVQNGARLSKGEVDEAHSFLFQPFESVSAKQLEGNFEFIYWLTPDAFCYYLPGILCASARESRRDLILVESVVGMLARTPDVNSFDSFFRDRWMQLTRLECQAMQEWLMWLAEDADSERQVELSKAFDVISYIASLKS